MEAPILWPPDVNSQLIGKDSYAGKNQKQKENRVAENEMVRWLDNINDLMNMNLAKLGQKDSVGQGCLACCSPWGCKESDIT